MTDSEILQMLLAKDQIREKIYRYCRGVDRCDLDLACSIFAPEAHCDYGDAWDGDAPGCMEAIIDAHLGGVATSHQVTNVTIKVDGDAAVSEAYCIAIVQSNSPEDGDVIATHVRSRYNDTWTCVDGEWLITERIVSGDVTWMGYLTPFMMDQYNTARGESFADDPSYRINH